MIIKSFIRHGVKFRMDEMKDFNELTPRYNLMYYNEKIGNWMQFQLVKDKKQAKEFIDLFYKMKMGMFEGR